MYNDAFGETSSHNLHTSGRILLNIWRAMQTELKLPIYNFEACIAAVLQLRVPEIPAHVLSGARPCCAVHKVGLACWAVQPQLVGAVHTLALSQLNLYGHP
jgi:hypothetical protein